MTVNLSQLQSQLGLTAPVKQLEHLYTKLLSALSGLSQEDRNNFLLIAEREILSKAGHIMTVKIGANEYENTPKCAICGSKVDKTDYSLMLISRWEESTFWQSFCKDCLDQGEYEFNFDVLDGRVISRIGLT